jgi:ATP-dependent exoDNAse (exonuclease V) beta subunit
MYHISALAGGAKPRYPNKSLVGFNSFDELRVESEHSAELKKLLNLGAILASGKGTHANIVSIKEVIVEDVEEANYTITTCHKSKGLEWDYVKLDEDMLYVDEEQDYDLVDLLKTGQTLNLLYVAVTRAKYSVKLPQLVQEVISSASYLRAEW